MAHPTTFVRRAEAVTVLRELERQAQAGGIDPAGSKITFGTYAECWLRERAGLRPRTVDIYASLLRRHLLPRLSPVPLGQLDIATVRIWRDGLLKSGVSLTMTAKSYRLLRAILNTALIEDELIMVNPCRIKGAGKERAPERPTLSLDQLYELVEMVPPRWQAFLLLKTFASLRWGEITALTRADVDIDRCTVQVRRQFVATPGAGLTAGPPETRAGLRVVTFPKAILPALSVHLDEFSVPGADGLVFPNEHGNPWRRPNFNSAVGWAELRERLGVPELHLHDLRPYWEHAGRSIGRQSA